MEVNIKRIERGLNWGAKTPDGKIMQKYTNCVDRYVPGLDRITGAISTGLTKKEETEFEKKLRLEEGSLASNGAYWDSFAVVIPEAGLTLNTDLPEHELIYKVMHKDSIVANSLEEARISAKAEYVMTSTGAEAKEKNTRRDVIATAFALYAKMSKEDVIDALYILKPGIDPEQTDAEVCRNTLGELVENNPSKFIEAVGDKAFKEKVWILRLIKKGLLRKAGVGMGTNMPIYYEDIMLGKGLDNVVEFLRDKENQNIYVALQKLSKRPE